MQIQARFRILLQYLLPQHGLSRLAGWIANCRWRWLKKKLINDFIQRYKVDLSIAEFEKADDYPNFNSFFTRALKASARPIAPGTNAIACPVDGYISQIGEIHNDLLFQAKNHYFKLLDLLGGEQVLAENFYHGKFATLYLAPQNYHRVHMPIRGELMETIYIPGKLFSVNPNTTAYVPGLFARNERLVCLFDTSLGKMAVILIGAMLVSGIKTVWPLTLPCKNLTKKPYSPNTIILEKGDELGYFTMGSTVILLFQKDTIAWEKHLKTNLAIQMGELIAQC